MLLAGRSDGDFNVLAQSCEELHEASDREVTRAISHQQGDLRLPYAENCGDLDLCQAAALDDRIDLKGELRLEQLLLGIGKAKVREDVSAAFSDSGNVLMCFLSFGFHLVLPFFIVPLGFR
jgi:hypothetical protein